MAMLAQNVHHVQYLCFCKNGAMNRADLTKDPHEVAQMFDDVAPRYDLMNSLLSLGQDRSWRRATLEAVEPQPGQRLLDLAAGTGTSSLPFHEAGMTVTAADLSEGMLAEGRRRHPELNFVQADAAALPFEDDSFDAVTISFGLRNVAAFEQALREMHRVIRPGGRVVVCEFSTPTLRAFRPIYQNYLMPAAGTAVLLEPRIL